MSDDPYPPAPEDEQRAWDAVENARPVRRNFDEGTALGRHVIENSYGRGGPVCTVPNGDDLRATLAFTDDRQLTCLSGCRKLPADADGARAVVELWPALDRDAALGQLHREPEDDQPSWRVSSW